MSNFAENPSELNDFFQENCSIQPDEAEFLSNILNDHFIHSIEQFKHTIVRHPQYMSDLNFPQVVQDAVMDLWTRNITDLTIPQVEHLLNQIFPLRNYGLQFREKEITGHMLNLVEGSDELKMCGINSEIHATTLWRTLQIWKRSGIPLYLLPSDQAESTSTVTTLHLNHSAVLLRPNVSASAIANTYPEKYDIFAQVCGAGTYIPNARLQALIGLEIDQQKIISCKCDLERSLQCVDTFRNIPGEGSESTLVNCNLQSMLQNMAKFSVNNVSYTKINIMKASMHLAGSASPEHGLTFSGGSLPSALVVAGTAVKAVETSLRKCYPQLISICGSSCIEMNRLGLSRENSVVPGIVMAGSTCQFLAVYLLKDNFPVLVALSPELNPFGTYEEQHAVAEWCLRLVSFADATADMLPVLCSDQPSPNLTNVCLNMTEYFAKPVRSNWKLLHQQQHEESLLLFSNKNIRLNQIMRMYERIRVSCRPDQGIDPKEVILFPEGVVSVPGDDVPESDALRLMLIKECVANGFIGLNLRYRPLILFPRLSANEGWCTTKPSAQQRQQYLEQLQLANNALNTAKIAHLDERPVNIMWRERVNGEFPQVELRLIDFEDAVLFDDVIPAEFVKVVVESQDWRYPFKSGDQNKVQFASELHNIFFYEAVSQWTVSAVEDFDDFMYNSGAQILLDISTRIY